VMGSDLLHSKGYNITIKGLNPKYFTKSIYGVQGSSMLFT